MAQMQVNGITAPLQQTNTNIKCLYVTHDFGLVNCFFFATLITHDQQISYLVSSKPR